MPWDPKTFGKHLRTLRLARNMSQNDLGKMIQLGSSAVAWIESGEKSPSIRVFVALAEALGVSPDGLLEWPKPRMRLG